jgi:hypothetical protein
VLRRFTEAGRTVEIDSHTALLVRFKRTGCLPKSGRKPSVRARRPSADVAWFIWRLRSSAVSRSWRSKSRLEPAVQKILMQAVKEHF